MPDYTPMAFTDGQVVDVLDGMLRVAYRGTFRRVPEKQGFTVTDANGHMHKFFQWMQDLSPGCVHHHQLVWIRPVTEPTHG